MNWMHILLGYFSVFMFGVLLIVLVPSPNLAAVVGTIWEISSLILIMLFLIFMGSKVYNYATGKKGKR